MPEPTAFHTGRESYEERISRITGDFTHAMGRFLSRLEGAGRDGETPANGKWSAAQIAWHVALVNEAFAGLMSGTVKGVAPAPPGFTERNWQQIGSRLPERLEASRRVEPPTEVRMPDALARLRASGEALRASLASLTAERGSGFTLKSPIVGEISVYQIAEWATAHVIRHNAQAKRILGG